MGGKQIDEASVPFSMSQKTVMEKAKHSIKDLVAANMDFEVSPGEMQYALFGKFIGKALQWEHIKKALPKLWSSFRAFSIADMRKGFYFIWCHSLEMVEKLLWDGPWGDGTSTGSMEEKLSTHLREAQYDNSGCSTPPLAY